MTEAHPARDPLPRRWTVVTGVIGADTHVVGHRIVSMALEQEGFHVVALGALTPPEEFVKAAIETAADAILVSSLYGQGELDAQGFRAACIEAGLADIVLYIGGNLVVGKQPWPEVEQRFLAMGFDRVYPPGTRPKDFIPQLRRDLEQRRRATADVPADGSHRSADGT